MAGEGFMRVAKLKGAAIITAAARHNRREIQAERGSNESIHPERTAQNQTIAGPATADAVGQLARDLMAQAGVDSKRLRKDAVRCLEFVFSLPLNHPAAAGAYFHDCLKWVQRSYNGHILSADVHHDESAPHCHVLLLPLVEGRMVGSDLVGDKRKLSAAQGSFHAEVAARYGLQKPPARLSGATKERAAALVLERFKALSDPVLRSAAWPVVRDAILTDPRPWLLQLDIVCTAVQKPLKTMAQIFTSAGKGARKEKPIGFEARRGRGTSEEPTPIGFGGQKKHRTLCSVGFGPETPPAESPAPASPAPSASAPLPSHTAAPVVIPAPHPAPETEERAEPEELVRVRDSDHTPDQYDPDTGEFFHLPAPRPRRRDIADSQVRAALAMRAAAHHARTAT